MRILVIGDSHTRDLDTSINFLRPHYLTYRITVGSQTGQIITKYRQELPFILHFNPTVALVHMGHNDIMIHPSLNPFPTHPRTVAAQTIAFGNELTTNHHGISIYNSSIYPRTLTHDSYLDEYDVGSYNKKAKRYGQLLRPLSHQAGYNCLLNNILWRRISKSIEESAHFTRDGLHITKEAKLLVAQEFLSILEQA
jgi:lysophospholipase L1-like esterase